MYKNMKLCVAKCKNLEYISLSQSRAMLAEPSKMHRNRPLAVHPATLVPPREGARPEYKSSKTNQKKIAYLVYTHI
jgi:hypothetical protein